MPIKYDTIGNNYNETRKADPFLSSQFFKFLEPKSNHAYLDIGCGTGNYTIALYEKGINIIGIDPSQNMLNEAKKKSSHIEWNIGTAEQTGLHSESIHGITACLTIHHWNNLDLAFTELYRVLKPNSKIVIFTSTPKQMSGYWLNHYFPEMLNDSISQMPELANVKLALAKAGFLNIKQEPYFIQLDLEDLFLYSGKHKPELYFNAQVRHGISSFADLAHQDEIANGLKLLKNDIKTGALNKIIENYKNNLGDYLFIIGHKA